VSCRTALSDLEVEHDEGAQGELYEFAYPLADGSGEVVVATTRPETMLGDTAVAVHPDDPRHQAKIGKTIKHPFTGREFKVIADAVLVDPKFGTGAVKVTPAHDPNDFDCGKRNNLPFISIFDEKGLVTAEGGPYVGIDRFKARKKVKEDLAALGLERGSKKHVHSVGHCQRCHTVVEPMMSTQWFVKMEPLAKPAIEAVEQGKTRFVPETWTKTFYHWMNNIRDWCISRQLWWGHRIPAWYCAACKAPTVARETPSACVHCGGKELTQDEDVLDTWFSSWLWPFATLGWPEQTRELRTFYPTTVMETGYDILFFWVARMLMAGLHFMKKVPFRTVYLHTMVTDEKGEKMSKVKGNTIDPVEVVQKHGADALRFALAWLTNQAAQGKNIKFSWSNVEDARRFANKIWNATRFVLMNLDDYDPDQFADRTAEGPDSAEFDLPERWILSRVQRATEEINTALEDYRFAEAAQAVYHFIWDEICDWYIELAKVRLQDPARAAERWKIQGTLVTALDAAMRSASPLHALHHRGALAETAQAPGRSPEHHDHALSHLRPALPGRRHRGVHGAGAEGGHGGAFAAHREQRAVKRPGPRSFSTSPTTTRRPFSTAIAAWCPSRRSLGELVVRRSGDAPVGSVMTAMAGDVEVMLVAEVKAADTGAERAKLEKDRATLLKDRDHLAKKLANPQFIEKAPPAVLDKDRARLAEIEACARQSRIRAHAAVVAAILSNRTWSLTSVTASLRAPARSALVLRRRCPSTCTKLHKSLTDMRGKLRMRSLKSRRRSTSTRETSSAVALTERGPLSTRAISPRCAPCPR
jgi:valyl-tRNA synthetase